MNEQANEMITAIGALAESCGVLYRQLIKNGFSQGDALALVKEYIVITVCPKK